ncbi:MAG TPA: hypothetical protein VL689_00480 [Paraburkholderia sp.]|jgi:hypothetical protein|nr:hypothetical protein [Paraburkholderia sp.]
MSPHTQIAPGALHASLVEQEIAHIRRVMPLSLTGDLGGPILPARYWRRRLVDLLGTGNVSQAQLAQIEGLLVQLDEFERQMADNHAATNAAAHRSTDTR